MAKYIPLSLQAEEERAHRAFTVTKDADLLFVQACEAAVTQWLQARLLTSSQAPAFFSS